MKMTKITIIGLFLLAFALPVLAQKDAKNGGMFWIRENGKYGYIDHRFH